jgi:hypothetical protein
MNEFSLSDLAAVTGGNRDNNGFGDGSGWWILLLFILLGGFNGNRGYGGGYGGAGGVGGNELYPWLNNAENINGGFRDQMIQTTLQGIQTQGQNLATQLCNCCGDLQQALCNGFNGVNLGMLQGFSGVEQSANTRQVANMQQQFANQTAMMQGFNGVQAQLADCCCENRLATANQTATILAEHCSDRAALSDGIRDVIQSQTAQTQSILDKLCQLELDGYKRQVADEQRANAELRSQLTQARFDASQQAQNAFIQQGLTNEVDALYNRLNNCPVPSMPVYGRTPIFTCQPQGQGCGCGCGSM